MARTSLISAAFSSLAFLHLPERIRPVPQQPARLLLRVKCREARDARLDQFDVAATDLRQGCRTLLLYIQ